MNTQTRKTKKVLTTVKQPTDKPTNKNKTVLKVNNENSNRIQEIETTLNNYPEILQFNNILLDSINDVVNIEMNNNEYMINNNIIFSAKIKQLEYFLHNDQYRNNLLNALKHNDKEIIIHYLMMYDPEVYTNEWENESKRLTTSIIQSCIPNTTYKCPKCNEEKVFSYSQQIRSGDEGTTHFFKCCNCGHTWRED